MLDWFWANMEKCYYLWAPGSHKRFNWVKTPWEYGLEDSVHMIAESTRPGLAVFGGEGIEIHRLPLRDFYPFRTALSHVICEGVFNEKGELVDSTIHEWEDSLPRLYALWKDHPDPTQNVRCDLRVKQDGQGRFVYRSPNGPVRL